MFKVITLYSTTTEPKLAHY